jgi:hypothetical protein
MKAELFGAKFLDLVIEPHLVIGTRDYSYQLVSVCDGRSSHKSNKNSCLSIRERMQYSRTSPHKEPVTDLVPKPKWLVVMCPAVLTEGFSL